jgi:hypothetical protein
MCCPRVAAAAQPFPDIKKMILLFCEHLKIITFSIVGSGMFF